MLSPEASASCSTVCSPWQSRSRSLSRLGGEKGPVYRANWPKMASLVSICIVAQVCKYVGRASSAAASRVGRSLSFARGQGVNDENRERLIQEIVGRPYRKVISGD